MKPTLQILKWLHNSHRLTHAASLLASLSLLALPGHAEDAVRLYDADPGHLWNRMYAALFIRRGADNQTYGEDALDPLYWSETRHLLEGDSNIRATRLLDEFIATHGEKLIQESLERALFQMDLWSLFDWAATRNRYQQTPFHAAEAQQLSMRLATVIRRLSLTRQEINSLPDNYSSALAHHGFPPNFNKEKPEESFLPPDLFKEDGDWVCVQTQPEPLPAPVHTREFGGRSAFLLFINLPKGRRETLDYLEKLNHFTEPWIFDKTRMEEKGAQLFARVMPHSFNPEIGPWVNPEMPQFPTGTKFALVRRALLIDDQGELVASPLTQSLQMRVYITIDAKRGDGGQQALFEFKLFRSDLIASKAGGLRATAKGDSEFSTFLQIGIDPFEFKSQNHAAPADPRNPALGCLQCHGAMGIFSILSHSQLFTGRTILPPRYEECDIQQVQTLTTDWKRDQFTWGLLQGLWHGIER